jgi:hypothetical protein
MVKITGLDDLQLQLEQAQRAFAALDGDLITLKFDPENQASIDAAIASMEQAIDAKAAPFRGNMLIDSIIPQIKEKYRIGIMERAKGALDRR